MCWVLIKASKNKILPSARKLGTCNTTYFYNVQVNHVTYGNIKFMSNVKIHSSLYKNVKIAII